MDWTGGLESRRGQRLLSIGMGKFVPAYATKTYNGSRDRALDKRKCSSSRSGRFTPEERANSIHQLLPTSHTNTYAFLTDITYNKQYKIWI